MKVCNIIFAPSKNQNHIKMKKILTLVLLMMTIAFQSVADDSKGNSSSKSFGLEYHKTNNTATPPIHRAPMRFPSIDVSYHTDTKTIYVMSDESVDADVTVTDPSGMIIGYSDSINTTLYIGQCNSQIAILRIDGNGWYAIAEITL